MPQVTRFRSRENPFDIRDQRAMVSLGALSKKRQCTFSCPFCYVQADFLSYPNFSIPEIVNWLNKQPNDSFNIIYVSGDTDSFAPPRTDQALLLLEELLSLGKDVLFTTRMVMDSSKLKRLGKIVENYNKESLRVFGCISIIQKTIPYLEPPPIASPTDRIAQLHRFMDLGLMTILAARPFLPIVPLSDYDWILRETSNIVHAILGENWYADSGGILESNVLGAGNKLKNYTLSKMPFDDNNKIWKVYNGDHIEKYFQELCLKADLPFFMRSMPAIEWIRQNI